MSEQPTTMVAEPAYYQTPYPSSGPPGHARHRAGGGGGDHGGVPVWGWIVLGVTILALVVIGGALAIGFLYANRDSVAAATAPAVTGPTKLEKAKTTCATSGQGLTIEDNGRTLDIDTQGEDEYSGASYTEFECVLSALDVPGSVRSKVGNTRALDGMQTASWTGYSASWNYHPDNGISMVISMV